MGRSYWFECERCGYRETVSGGADKGVHFAVQTIVCRDCKRLYDVVVKVKLPAESGLQSLRQSRGLTRRRPGTQEFSSPPAFQAMLSRLPYTGIRRFRWITFKPRCPMSPAHRVAPWNVPGKCPKCGVLMEQNALPFRLWD